LKTKLLLLAAITASQILIVYQQAIIHRLMAGLKGATSAITAVEAEAHTNIEVKTHSVSLVEIEQAFSIKGFSNSMYLIIVERDAERYLGRIQTNNNFQWIGKVAGDFYEDVPGTNAATIRKLRL